MQRFNLNSINFLSVEYATEYSMYAVEDTRIWYLRKQHLKNLFPKPLTSTPTCYSFVALVIGKQPIFSTKFTQSGKCRYYRNMENKISTNSTFTIIFIYIHKENQRNKVLFGSKTSIHFCVSLIPNFNHFVYIAE